MLLGVDEVCLVLWGREGTIGKKRCLFFAAEWGWESSLTVA